MTLEASMSTPIRMFLLVTSLFAYQSASTADWDADWRVCRQQDGPEAFQACARLVAGGNKSDYVYLRLGHLYEKKFDLILATLFYQLAFEANPANTEANNHYLRLMNDPNHALQEMGQKGWLKQLQMELPK